jgi:hypothetical protein
VEALQFHSNTQFHWSIGSIFYFLTRVSAVRGTGMHKLAMEPGSPASIVSLQNSFYLFYCLAICIFFVECFL